VIWWTIAQSKKANEAWSGAARALQLAFDPGSMMQSRTLLGKLGGNRVRVDTVRHGSKNSVTYTRYRISYPRPLRLGLRIEQEGLLGGIKKAFGSQDILTGDTAFDQVALVKGHDGQAIRGFLTPARRSRIREALFAFRKLEIGDEDLGWECQGVIRSQSRLEETVRSLCRLACALWEESAETLVPGAMEAASLPATVASAPHWSSKPPALPGSAARTPRTPAVPQAWVPVAVPQAAAPTSVGPVAAWSMVAPRQPAGPPPIAAVGSAARSPEPGLPEPAAAAAPALAKEVVCAELFREGINSSEVERIFVENHAGKRVTWQGRVRDCHFTSFDFVFGGQPCTKLTLELVTLGGGSFGGRTVGAVAQLPPEARETLGAKIGTEVTVSGELLKIDRLLRLIYLKDAMVV
jgi:hypothetical protein